MTGAITTTRSALAGARAFYCDALGGRQMHHTTLGDDGSVFCFRVGGELVVTGPAVTNDRITLVVDDAVAIAEQCWDAGFAVHVRGTADATTLAVIDPFGLELELVSSDEGGRHLTPPASTTPRPPDSRPTARAG